MFNQNVKFKNLGGIIPKWSNDLRDAGLDLHAAESVRLEYGARAIIPLGIASEFNPMWVAFIKERSGLAAQGFYLHAGVIDASYRGEWKVVVDYRGTLPMEVKRGDRVAQAIFLPCFHPAVIEVDQLSESQRGSGGFGSSGR